MGCQEENCIAQGGAGKSKSKAVHNIINESSVGNELYEELSETPAPAEAQAQAELVESEKKVEEVGGVKTVAAKKNKKKKEKEKEKKKAAAAAVVDEKQEATKGKVADKKVSKHVLKIQESLEREREAKEKKKREEEEKLRKEEEERLRIEEEERIPLQKMREKKDRKKEKKLKDKQEGKPVTRKEKEEARRLESRRNQILANAECFPTVPTKRSTYQTKGSKAQGNCSASAEHLEEQAKIVVDSVCVEEKCATGDAIEEKVAEKEEEDVKDWDDDGHKLPDINAFSDEEKDSESKDATLFPTKKVNHKQFKQQGTDNKKSQTSEPTEESKPEENTSELRAPVCCVMGHVDSGKTKLLDCIRGTKVQEGEAGGITQQIGATYIPAENISDRTKGRKTDEKLIVPGLLVIDTPGHESFANLRLRGSSLCDIVVLVVDITGGLQPQTIETLDLLGRNNTKFIVALNKVDRLYAWKTCSNEPIVKALKKQSKQVMSEFEKRLSDIKMQFMEQGFNTELYNRHKESEMDDTVSIVPISAKSGEGIPDLLLLLMKWAEKMSEKLTYSSTIQCTVLDVSVVEGCGTTIDVVLLNGTLNQGDQIVVCGKQGAIVTSIRELLTPLPMKELRVKGTYLHHKAIKAAQAVKISAGELEHAIAGTSLYVVEPNVNVEDLKEKVLEDMNSVTSRIDTNGEGVCVHASTLGSLDALLEHLKTLDIPVSAENIGPVSKKDVIKAGVMLGKKKKEYATILAFNVKIQDEAELAAVDYGVKIIPGDVIFSLSIECKKHINAVQEEKRKEIASETVFPCVLKITPNGFICRDKSYILLGVEILHGSVKVGTPLCYPEKEFVGIGKIESIHHDRKPLDCAKKGQTVAIKISGEEQKMLGRHFDFKTGDKLVSHITRSSIDILRTYYRDILSTDDWKLVRDLKKLLRIP